VTVAGVAARRRAGVGLSVAVAAVVVLVDQLTKWWALETLDTRTIHVVWTLQLRLTRNSGMAFGQGEGLGPLVGVVALVVVVGLLIALRRPANRLAAVAVGLVIGGAAGNIVDRVARSGDDGFLSGAVVDFIDLQWWPVFNVADIGITVGAALLVLLGLLEGREERGGAAEEPPAA